MAKFLLAVDSNVGNSPSSAMDNILLVVFATLLTSFALDPICIVIPLTFRPQSRSSASNASRTPHNAVFVAAITARAVCRASRRASSVFLIASSHRCNARSISETHSASPVDDVAVGSVDDAHARRTRDASMPPVPSLTSGGGRIAAGCAGDLID
jgi:hypothetical protein